MSADAFDGPLWDVQVQDFEDSSAVWYKGYVIELLGHPSEMRWNILGPNNRWLRNVRFMWLTEALRFVDELCAGPQEVDE